MEFLNQRGEKILTERELGVGGEGSVFSIKNHKDLVVKIYHQAQLIGSKEKEKYEKLKHMVMNPPSDNATLNHVSISWPLDLVFSADYKRQFVGFIMKRLDESKSFSLFEYINLDLRTRKHPHFSYKYLLTAAYNIAQVFASLHQKGYIIGDVNETNILIKDDAAITVIDTDSFQVRLKSGMSFRCTKFRPLYLPPELHGIKLSNVDREEHHDNFSLGVVIFQLLMLGFQPYDGQVPKNEDWPTGKRIVEGNFPYGNLKTPIVPTKIFPKLSILTPELQNLFLRCFEDKKNPKLRPSAIEWKKHLYDAIIKLSICNKVSSHLYCGHLRNCPWCERLAAGNLDPFPFPEDSQLVLNPEQEKKRIQLAIDKQQMLERERILETQKRIEEEERRTREANRREQLARQKEIEEQKRKAEIKPGRWRITQINLPAEYVEMEFYQTGELSGVGYQRLDFGNNLANLFVQLAVGKGVKTFTTTGQWQYDYNTKILDIWYTTTLNNGQRVSDQQQFKIISSKGIGYIGQLVGHPEYGNYEILPY